MYNTGLKACHDLTNWYNIQKREIKVKQSNLRLKQFLLTFALCVMTFFMQKQNAYAADVYLDSDGNFCIMTEDKIKTSSIWYKTIGFDISRCTYNPASKTLHDSRESFYFVINLSQTETTQIGGVEVNIFKVPLEQLMSKASSEWKKEVMDALNGEGPPVYIRFDSIMKIYHGIIEQPGTYRNYAAIDGTNPAAIKAAEAWANPKGLDTHYNRYFLIGANLEIPPEELVEDEANKKISSETTPYMYRTGNESPDGYDLGEGIPSGKDIKNDYQANSWYGSTDVWNRTVTTSKYTGIGYEFSWTLEYTDYEDEWNEDTQEWEQVEVTKYMDMTPYTGTFDERLEDTTSMVPAVAFTYLANADFYDLTSTGIYNLAYPGTIYYDSTKDTPMKAITTKKYVDVATEAEGMLDIETWFADTDKHVEWPDINKDTRVAHLGTFTSESDAKEAMLAQFVSIKNSIQNQISSNTITRNDYLMIDGKEYLLNEDVTGCNFTEDGQLPTYNFCTKSSAKVLPWVIGSISGAVIPEENGTQTVTIPRETDNGMYPTGMEVTYSRIIKQDGKAFIFYADSNGEWFDNKENYERLSAGHCLDPYNGEINVHTPVIAPVEILDDEGEEIDSKTQLENDVVNAHASYQLLLDEDYIFDWESAVHRDIPLYGDSGKYSKYDEFVKAKWVCFPFDVEYNGVYYKAYNHSEPDDGGDDWNISGKYTDWIELEEPEEWDAEVNFQAASDANGWQPTSDNHWRQTPIYIPSYADEVGRPGEDAYIYYKVEAYNVDGRYGGDHTKEQEEIYNKNYTYEYSDDGAKYVATYRFGVQTSGIIYDFMITGTSDKDSFLYEQTELLEADHVPFCTYKMEKHLGTLNRYGETAMRYRTDGELTHDWELSNTLPLMQGRSASFDEMGYVMKGSRISFSFKTIANLWSENTDYVEITPTFRYIRPDGTVTDNIQIYYYDKFSNEEYVQYGKETKLNIHNVATAEDANKVKLIHKQFEDSYYDEMNSWIFAGYPNDYQIGDWLNKTLKHHNTTTGDDLTLPEMMNREHPSFNLSSIVLNSGLRLLSGEWEQLKRNTRGTGREFAGILRYSDGENWDEELQRKFEKSMQTWYGQYYVPAELYIVDLDDPSKQHIYTDPDNQKDGEFSLYEYMIEKGGIRSDDEVFVADEGNGGYLIVNFDIKTRDEGRSHLKYYGTADGDRNMWDTEGFIKDVEVDGNPIDLEEGDIAIVDLGLSVKDKYKGAIFNIN